MLQGNKIDDLPYQSFSTSKNIGTLEILVYISVLVLINRKYYHTNISMLNPMSIILVYRTPYLELQNEFVNFVMKFSKVGWHQL